MGAAIAEPLSPMSRTSNIASLREQWKQFVAVPSGRRFITRYRARRGQRGGLLRKCLIVGAGLLLMLAGVAMLVLPGPGLVAIVVGAAFIAEESRISAHLLDRIDQWGTRIYARWRARRQARASDEHGQ
jgi:hypothetical protein